MDPPKTPVKEPPKRSPFTTFTPENNQDIASTPGPSSTSFPKSIEVVTEPVGKDEERLDISTKTFLDREQRAIAELLTRFKNIVDLVPESDDADPRITAAVQTYQMEVESQALVSFCSLLQYHVSRIKIVPSLGSGYTLESSCLSIRH